MRWWQAGLIMYAFAAPSSIMGIAFTFSHAGLLGGTLGCLVVYGTSAIGALLFVDLLSICPGATMFSDIGRVTLGAAGERLGLVLQMTNFCLYLPVALLTTAQALQQAVQPAATTCVNYYVFAVALVCFASTQVRDLNNSTPLAAAALFASLAVAALQLAIVAAHPLDAKPSQWFGHPDASVAGSARLALALTTCAWSYVPSVLTVELAQSLGSAQALRRAILLSAALSAVVSLSVGLPVAALWGASLPDPISISKQWPVYSASARALSALLCAANLVSYCLDSVPCCRYCQRKLDPHFSDGWSAAECMRYALLTSPSILFAVVAAVFVGQPGGLFTMLAWVTAVTVPALNLIFPAVCTLFARDAPIGAAPQPHEMLNERLTDATDALLSRKRPAAWGVLAVGVVVLLVCFYAALGRTLIPAVRGPEIIGCEGWGIYHSNGTSFSGW